MQRGNQQRRHDEAGGQRVAQLERPGAGASVVEHCHAGVVCGGSGLMQPLRLERLASLERQLGTPHRILRALCCLGKVVGGGQQPEPSADLAELGQKFGLLLAVGGLLERAHQIGDRRLRRASCPRLVRGVAELLDDPGVALGTSEQQMCGDALRRRAVCVQQPCGVQVAARALRHWNVVGDRLANERMDEAQGLAGEQDLDRRQAVCRDRGRRHAQPR